MAVALFQAMSFLEHVREDRLRLSTGMFSVGMHLVPTVRSDGLSFRIILR